MCVAQPSSTGTNPLTLIPARIRAIVVVVASIIAVATPFIIADVPTIWRHILQALCAVAAVYSGGQSLANLTPDKPATDHLNEPGQ